MSAHGSTPVNRNDLRDLPGSSRMRHLRPRCSEFEIGGIKDAVSMRRALAPPFLLV